SLNFYSLYNYLLVNRLFCCWVVPLLWADPLRKANSNAFKKVIDTYLLHLNKGEKEELDKLLTKNTQIREEYKKRKPLLFSYVDFLQQYSFYETRE
ncbi:43502_t:CDS:1, partial [Gigaspora margarita]